MPQDEVEHRVTVLLEQLGEAINELVVENRLLRRSNRSRGGSVTAFSRIDNRLMNFFKSNVKPAVHVYTPGQHFVGHRDGIIDVSSCRFEERLLVSASVDHSAIVWHTAQRRALIVVRSHKATVNSACFHPQLPVLLTASGDNTAALTSLDIPTNIRRGSESLPQSDDKADLSVRSWPGVVSNDAAVERSESDNAFQDMDSGASTKSVHCRPSRFRCRSNSYPDSSRATVVKRADAYMTCHSDVVSCADWITDGDLIVTGSWDHSAVLWAVDGTSPRMIRKLLGHEGRINNLSTNLADKFVITASDDETFRLWDIRAPKNPTNIFRGHHAAVTSAIFAKSDSTELIASAGEDRTVQVWDMRIVKKPITEIACQSRVNRLCCSPSGMLLTLPADDGSLKSYNLSGDLVIHTPRESCKAILNGAVWSADESEVYSGGWDLAVTGWTASTVNA